MIRIEEGRYHFGGGEKAVVAFPLVQHGHRGFPDEIRPWRFQESNRPIPICLLSWVQGFLVERLEPPDQFTVRQLEMPAAVRLGKDSPRVREPIQPAGNLEPPRSSSRGHVNFLLDHLEAGGQ